MDTVKFVSDFLERGEYQADSQELTLYFKDGSVYQYDKVPRRVFTELQANATGPGAFFNKSIRVSYESALLKEPTPPPPPPPAAAPQGIRCAATLVRRNVVSAVLDGVAYDASTRCLELYFDSKHVYRYGNVPPDVYQKLLQPNANYNALFPRRKGAQKYPFERVR